MHASIRSYRVTDVDAFGAKMQEEFVERVETIDGFVGYYVVDGGDGTITSITVGETEEAVEASTARAEHWVVVNGTAIVTRDDEEILLRENESVFVPLGCMHRLENPGKVPLNLIEVQSGAYLGEDDIVRMQDIYHRV